MAERLGVSRQSLNRWERGRETVPRKYIHSMAELLGVQAEELLALRECLDATRKIRRWLRPRRRRLPLYKCTGTLEQACELGGHAPAIVSSAERLLTPAALMEFEQRFPRDAASELLGACHFIVIGGKLTMLSPQQSGCTSLVMHPRCSIDYPVYAGHRRRHAIVLAWEGARIVLFPQVRIMTTRPLRAYRLDFLMLFRYKGFDVWINVEIDGRQHRETLDDDEARTLSLALPALRYGLAAVTGPDFANLVLSQARMIWLAQYEKLRASKRRLAS